MVNGWKDQIFEQKSLWEVYQISRNALPRSRINRFIFWSTTIIILLFYIWILFESGQKITITEAMKFLRHIANHGLIFSLGILGFLIAGFSIFASITKAELFIMLAKIPYEKSNINNLQFIFFNFLNVFSVYILLLTYSLLIAIGLSEHSPLTKLGSNIVLKFPETGLPVICLLTGILGIWLVSAILKLKSFIWNLYQAVLLSIATESELQERKIKNSESHPGI